MFDVIRLGGLAVLAALLCAPQLSRAQVPAAELEKPPPNALTFSILSTSGIHGQSAVWAAADGSQKSRDSVKLRGMVWEVDQSVRLGQDGVPVSLVVRGVTPKGDAAETFSVADGKATWKSPVDEGVASYSGPAFYVSQGGSWSGGSQLLLEALLTSADKSLALLPGGRARAERLTEAVVGNGTSRKSVVAWSISGLSSSPFALWATSEGKFFGSVGGLAVLPAGYEDSLQDLYKAQNDAIAAKSPALVNALLREPTGPVAFTHVRAFVHGDRFEPDHTVLVDKGVIVAVGPSGSIPVPSDAQVIDGAGKSLVPGLWDSHQHVHGDDGPFLLALGITSVRDPGNNNHLTMDRASRRASDQLLLPHVYPSLLIDGKGPNTAQLGTVATSLDEAIVAIRGAKANGFTGVKFYGSYDPAWIRASAATAHSIGLRVHGHVPAGMRPSEAINAGYDELTHIYFAIMEAMPDDVVATSNGMNRFNGSGRYAKDVDLSVAPMKSLIELMARKRTVMEPTLALTEALFVPENGDLSPAYAPYAGTLPPATERGFREGGFAVPKDLTRVDFRKSQAKLIALVAAMHKAGVPVVAGTDGSGLELVRELEIYVDAGMTASEALASATIVAARSVGVDKTTGSIDVGKVADLLLVDGDPSVQIGDLRNTQLVMMDGKLMDADALRDAAGFSGRPRKR